MKLKQNKVNFRKCPTCHGLGLVKRNTEYNHYTPEVRAEARRLFRTGMSYRKIGEKIGVNHAQKVASLIRSKIV